VKAQAVVFTEPGRLELREVTLRDAEPDEVIVATDFSSISSGTERLLFSGKLPGFPHLRFPFVPGYEAAGTVQSVGRDVNGIKAGDEVFVGGSMCYTDVAAAFGGQSSHLIKKAAQVIPLHGIPLAQAPLLALAATALHGVRRLGEVTPGDRVAVLGLGAVGRLAAGFLHAAGAHVVLVDRSAERLADAPGAERVDVSQIPLEESLTTPVKHAIEATGDPGQIARCARILQPGGNILLLSYYDQIVTPFVDLFVKEANLLVSREWAPPDLIGARDAIASGAVDISHLADHVVPIGRYEAAYETAFNDPSVLKVMLQWA
jgi:3-hydroxyethyl bacteriochlorophyllide a dehydrogenase